MLVSLAEVQDKVDIAVNNLASHLLNHTDTKKEQYLSNLIDQRDALENARTILMENRECLQSIQNVTDTLSRK